MRLQAGDAGDGVRAQALEPVLDRTPTTCDSVCMARVSTQQRNILSCKMHHGSAIRNDLVMVGYKHNTPIG